MSKDSKTLVYIAILFSMIFWSLSFVWYRQVFEIYQPVSVILMRLIISSGILILVGYQMKWLQPVRRKDVRNLLLLALFQPFLYFMGESQGMQFVDATTGAVIIATIPIFLPVAAWFILKERLSWINYTGMILSFAGVLLVILSQNLSINVPLKGLGLLFIAVIAAVIYSMIIKKLSGDYNAFTIITWQNSIGIFYFLPFFLWFESKHFLSVPFSADAWFPLLQLAIFASSLAFLFYIYAIRFLGVTKAGIFSNLIPVFTAIFAFFMLDEALTFQKAAGILIVIAGVFLSQVRMGKRGREVMTDNPPYHG
jgi:drug/metabolite transporter (DMT)-like permease